jgi:hypothetical protein
MKPRANFKYMDADWADNVSNKRSTSGFMFSFGSGAVS